MKYGAVFFLIFTCLLPDVAEAHAFEVRYVLPIPIWIYIYSCMAMLVVSFAAVGYFFATPVATALPVPLSVGAGAKGFSEAVGRPAILVLRGGAIGLLFLSIAAGLIGTQDPAANVNMTLFWVVFLLGFAYLTAFIGDVFAIINPWEGLLDICERCGLDLSTARLSYPGPLGYLPALCWYVVLIWMELFNEQRPFVLSAALLGYTFIVLVGAWLFGRATWLRYGEFFGLFFRLIGSMAPVAYLGTPDRSEWQWRLRPPFSGIVDEHKEHLSLLLFVLFMLSSTTYDGLHDTQVWLDIYWKQLLHLIEPLWGTDDLKEKARLIIKWHAVYQRSGLILLLALYVGIYLSVVAAAKKMAGAKIAVRELAPRFACSLIPIAFVYNVTHYFTFLITQIRVLPWLVTDPFGFGWNLLHLNPPPAEWALLDMGFIWHIQVALILTGHLVSVCAAHMISLRVFSSRRQALLSQIPMLLLMIVYTSTGLWILSLHLSQRITSAGG
jgi:hypothetical protein